MHFSDTQITALIVAVVPFVISLAFYIGKLLVSSLPATRQPQIMKIIQLGVNAAEQMGASSPGSVKKKMAEDFVNASLKSFGLSVDPNFVSVAIEALVLELNRVKPAVLPASVATSTPVLETVTVGTAASG